MAARSHLRTAVLAACTAGMLVACGPATRSEAPTTAPATVAPSLEASVVPSIDTSSPAAVVPDSPIAGIVIAVDSVAGQITGFTLRTNLGETYRFRIGQLQNADEFPASNLKDSMDASAPVLVFFDLNNGEFLVNRIEDAG